MSGKYQRQVRIQYERVSSKDNVLERDWNYITCYSAMLWLFIWNLSYCASVGKKLSGYKSSRLCVALQWGIWPAVHERIIITPKYLADNWRKHFGFDTIDGGESWKKVTLLRDFVKCNWLKVILACQSEVKFLSKCSRRFRSRRLFFSRVTWNHQRSRRYKNTIYLKECQSNEEKPRASPGSSGGHRPSSVFRWLVPNTSRGLIGDIWSPRCAPLCP